jgi:hypothetical protein
MTPEGSQPEQPEDEVVSDDELAALALAADPYALVPADAVPIRPVGWSSDSALLPEWYMPSPMGGRPGGRHHRSWQRKVAYVLIGTFLAIDAAGLCSTYGWISIA